MKISWQDSGYGQTGFHAEVEEYDAVPPVSALLLDHHPVNVNAEREAVAAYLAFGCWVSGDLKLPRHLGPTTRPSNHHHVRVGKPQPARYSSRYAS